MRGHDGHRAAPGARTGAPATAAARPGPARDGPLGASPARSARKPTTPADVMSSRALGFAPIRVARNSGDVPPVGDGDPVGQRRLARTLCR